MPSDEQAPVACHGLTPSRKKKESLPAPFIPQSLPAPMLLQHASPYFPVSRLFPLHPRDCSPLDAIVHLHWRNTIADGWQCAPSLLLRASGAQRLCPSVLATSLRGQGSGMSAPARHPFTRTTVRAPAGVTGHQLPAGHSSPRNPPPPPALHPDRFRTAVTIRLQSNPVGSGGVRCFLFGVSQLSHS